MDLVDLIETRRFLGSEFLLWLWFKSEVFDGRFNVGDRGACEVWLDDRLVLEALVVENEQSQLKGASPSVSPEAREALRQGKLPIQAKIRLLHDEQEFTFSFKAREFTLSGVKIPALISSEEDEKFYERMYLIEELEAIVGDLFGEYLGLRLSPSWKETLVPWMRAWIDDDKGEALPPADAYREVLAQHSPVASTRRITRVERAGAALRPSGDRSVRRQARPKDEAEAPAAAPAASTTEAAPAQPVEAAPEPPADDNIIPPAPF